MKKFLTAIALTLALPATTYAQAVAAAPKAGCCEKMKDMAGCKHMAKMSDKMQGMKAGANPPSGRDMPMAMPSQSGTRQNQQ